MSRTSSSDEPEKSEKSEQADVFLSHSSADKAGLVRPLAEFLRIQGVSVWYDEYSLRPGDSLSASIDKGLSTADTGLVVISPAFIQTATESGWTRYEFRGITANSIGQHGKRIIPVWHKISRDEVLDFSPPLADLLAISTEGRSIPQVAYEIMRVVAPQKAGLLSIYLTLARATGPATATNPADLKMAAMKPVKVDGQVVVRAAIINMVLRHAEVDFIGDVREFLDNLARDAHPEIELRTWEAIAAAYLAVVGKTSNPDERAALVRMLLAQSFGQPDEASIERLGADISQAAVRFFQEFAQLTRTEAVIGRDDQD